MARAIFQTIYDNVKQSIDDGTYAYQSYLRLSSRSCLTVRA